jgi:hypothetical protein
MIKGGNENVHVFLEPYRSHILWQKNEKGEKSWKEVPLAVGIF